MRRFITDASHELRTPLTTDPGFAEFYRQVRPCRRRDAMSRIERVTRMGGLVRDLLLLARLDAPAIALERMICCVGLARRGPRRCSAIATSRSISVSVLDGLAGTPGCQRRNRRLRQVLGNLVPSALQQHHPGRRGSRFRWAPSAERRTGSRRRGPGIATVDAHQVSNVSPPTRRTRSSGEGRTQAFDRRFAGRAHGGWTVWTARTRVAASGSPCRESSNRWRPG